MDKAATKGITEAEEQELHGGGTSASRAVDVDPEALGCPRCLRPLVPPVFQVLRATRGSILLARSLQSSSTYVL